MPAPTNPDTRSELKLTRDRLFDLGQQFPPANAAVQAAAAQAERAKVELDLRPSDKAVREAAAIATEQLEEAIRERDSITEAIERLRRHETALAAAVHAEASADLVEAQAAARKANAEAILAGAPAVRAWVGRVLADFGVGGRQIADVGHLVAEYLTGTFQHSTLSAGYQQGINAAAGEAQRVRDAIERGEVVP